MAHRCHTEVIAHVPEDLQYMLSLAAGKAERDRINNIILRDTCMQCEHRDGYENIQPHRVSFLATAVPSLQYMPASMESLIAIGNRTAIPRPGADRCVPCSTPGH